MFKRLAVCLILLLNLLRYITCDELEDDLKQQISNLSNLTGSCSEYFQYQLIDGSFINGKLTLPHMKIGDTVKMTFNATSEHTYSPGILLPDGSFEEVIKKLQEKQPISYYVGFPVMDDVPELLQIVINDKALCDGESIIPGNMTRLTLEHTLIIRNGFMQVFTYDINIPHFAEAANESCGLVDNTISINKAIHLSVGGKVINRGEYPWLVAIYKKHSTGIIFVCGGSLVTSKHILSAAHGFVEFSATAEKVTVMLGRHDLSNFMEDGLTIRDLKTIILHPEYKSGRASSDADLAILVMKEHVSFTKYIKPICLWNELAGRSQIVEQTGVVVGWGRNENDTMSTAPKEVSMKIVSGETCLRSSIAFNALTSNRTLCAGNLDGTGPCRGDSGGALMIKRDETWMVRGITSVALLLDIERCNLYEYTVYCDVAKHMPWIQNKTKQEEPLVTGSLEDICGISGSESRTEHPWLAAIYKHFVTGELFFCTGSIISSRSVLVPASCFINKELLQFRRLRVYLGRYDLSDLNEKGVVMRKVESLIFRYGDLSSGSVSYNVVLLQMKDPVSFTQYIKPICLWSDPERWNEKSDVILLGWILPDVRQEISTMPKSTEINSKRQRCIYGYTGPYRPIIFECIVFEGLISSTDRILIEKRHGRWMVLCESDNCSCKSSSQSLLYNHYTAYMMEWIRDNMLS